MNECLKRGARCAGGRISQLLLFSVAAAMCAAEAADGFADGFADPPREFGLQAWYHWVGDYVTEKGLAADLAAMADFGICAAHIFGPGHCPLPGKEIPGSDLWFDRVEFAAKEAAKHGIKLGAHNCPGWSSSGGPWIKPEDSMKLVVASQLDVRREDGRVHVPRPLALHGFYRDIAAYAFPFPCPPRVVASSGSLDVFDKWTVEFERPWAPKSFVFDFKGIHLWGRIRVSASADGHEWETLADLKLRLYRVPEGVPCIYDLPPAKAPCRFYRAEYLGPWPEAKVDRWPPRISEIRFEASSLMREVHLLNGSVSGPSFRAPGRKNAEKGIAMADIIDVTHAVAADGAFDCSMLPAGARYRIVRLGYTTTGAVCRPASPGATGLECDKLSRRGLDAHWPHMPACFVSTPARRAVFKTLTIDSYEQPGQNWTEEFQEEFAARRGYPVGKRLLSVVGYPVGTWGETARFLYDYSRTVSDLFADNYYGYFTKRCHEAGLLSVAETYGAPCDIFHAASLVDIPAGEIWSWRNGDGMSQFCKMASSAAHLAGSTGLAAAEAFTSFIPHARYETTPADMRRRTDDIWSRGINDIIYHSYVHQPWLNVRPGTTLGTHGTQLNRHTTWWKEGRVWSDYVRRGQYVLRAGMPGPDILVFAGEAPPHGLSRSYPGMEHDLIGVNDLWRLENAPGGGVRMPGGIAYPVLLAGNMGHVTSRTLEALRRLLEGGADIAALPPPASPSLADDPERWNRLRDSIWGKGGARFNGVRSVGRGRLVCVDDAGAAFKAFGRIPSVLNADSLSRIHRRVDGSDVYYLYNGSTGEVFSATVSFAAAQGTHPEEWDAMTGRRMAVPRARRMPDGRVELPVEIRPTHGKFLVFVPGEVVGEEEKGVSADGVAATNEVDLSCGWAVEFSGAGAPAGRFAFPKLISWSEHENEGIRYLAGHGRYRRTFAIPSVGVRNTRWMLDLGDVRDVATVTINGGGAKCLVEAPYVADVTDSLVPGENSIEVDVVNCWPNRMVGDAVRRAQKAAEPKSPLGKWPAWVLEDRPDSGSGIFTWSTCGGLYSATSPLVPAGLLGPVRLRSISSVVFQGGKHEENQR